MMSTPVLVFVFILTMVLVAITGIMWFIWMADKIKDAGDRIVLGNNGETWFLGIVTAIALYGVCLIFSYFSMLPKLTFTITIGG